MTGLDDPLERRLRAYRPIGPPPELRDRVLAMRSPQRARGWLLTAAALIALALLLQDRTARIDARIAAVASEPAITPATFLEAAEQAERQAAQRSSFFDQSSRPGEESP